MPVETWRDEYVGARTVWRGRDAREMNYYRIQASRDGTVLNFDPPLSDLATDGPVAGGLPDCRHMGRVPELDAGGWCEFGTRTDFHLRAKRADRRDADDHQRPDGGGEYAHWASAELG